MNILKHRSTAEEEGTEWKKESEIEGESETREKESETRRRSQKQGRRIEQTIKESRSCFPLIVCNLTSLCVTNGNNYAHNDSIRNHGLLECKFIRNTNLRPVLRHKVTL